MRQDQRRVTLTVDGVSYGVWDTKGGGTVDSEELKHRKGGMGAQRALGGPQTVENLTLAKLVEPEVWPEIRVLRGRVGKGDCTCTEQPLDDDGNAFGPPDVYTGKLKSVKSPDHDANSADAAMVELEISTNGTVG